MKFIIILFVLIHLSKCRDFYLGAFKKNDLLMSQDTLYKERIPFRFTYAKYGRTYNCLITYVRVLDRIGIGKGPRVQIIRGGLRKKFIVLRLTSPYNTPISVTIFVGCENKKYTNPPWKIIRPTTTSVTATFVKTTVVKSTTGATTIEVTADSSSTIDDKISTSVSASVSSSTTTAGPSSSSDLPSVSSSTTTAGPSSSSHSPT